jgi:hypothetical protein
MEHDRDVPNPTPSPRPLTDTLITLLAAVLALGAFFGSLCYAIYSLVTHQWLQAAVLLAIFALVVDKLRVPSK